MAQQSGATRIGDRTNRWPTQRGSAALVVTLLLVMALTLAALYTHRDLMVEQRTAMNQQAAAQAFEAAEAGLQWAEAQLNVDRRLGADCLPDATGTGSFRERYLRLDAASRLLPRPLAAGPGGRPGCAGSAAGFACSCPTGGPARLSPSRGDGPFPAFRVEFLAGGSPGVVRVIATGCSSAAPPCVDTSGRADATAQVEVLLGLLGAWRVPPTALLTAGGEVVAGPAVFPVAFPAGEVAIRAGGPIVVDPGADALRAPSVETDAALAARDTDRFFAATFGLDPAHWQAQPVVTRVVCRTDCAAALTAALADRGAAAMVWVDGDLPLAGPLVLGSTDRPVLIVVGGEARLQGAVELHGGLHASRIRWDDDGTGPGAAVHGALQAARDYRGTAAVAFHDDAAVTAVLTRFAGSFARVSGSWRDF